MDPTTFEDKAVGSSPALPVPTRVSRVARYLTFGIAKTAASGQHRVAPLQEAGLAVRMRERRTLGEAAISIQAACGGGDTDFVLVPGPGVMITQLHRSSWSGK